MLFKNIDKRVCRALIIGDRGYGDLSSALCERTFDPSQIVCYTDDKSGNLRLVYEQTLNGVIMRVIGYQSRALASNARNPRVSCSVDVELDLIGGISTVWPNDDTRIDWHTGQYSMCVPEDDGIPYLTDKMNEALVYAQKRWMVKAATYLSAPFWRRPFLNS